MAKQETVTTTAEETQGSTIAAKDIFLATLGFYGKVYEDGVAKLKELSEKREESYQLYVKRGEKLETQARDKYETLRNEDSKLNERIDNLRQSYGKLTNIFSAKSVEENAEEQVEAKADTKVDAKTDAKTDTKVNVKADAKAA